MGSRVSLPTSRTSFSVISANASAADRCRSTLSENESVERDRKGSPVKKLVSERSAGRKSLTLQDVSSAIKIRVSVYYALSRY